MDTQNKYILARDKSNSMKNVGWYGRHYKPVAGTKGNLKRHEPDYTDWEYSIALFGESTTWGHELEEDQKLHNVIKTPRPLNNFAYPAESNFHMWMKLMDQVKENGWPYMVVMGWTTPYRIADFKQGRWVAVDNDPPKIKHKTRWGPGLVEPIGHWSGKPYTDFLQRNETNLIEYSKLVIDSTQLMCKGNTKLFEWSWFNLKRVDLIVEKLDYSKDGSHPGPKSIQSLARKIEDEL